ncbi:MAG: lipoprotein [Candidatus Reddybacter sp.]
MTTTAYRRIFLFLPLLLLAVSALNACGNKGALYIPPPPIEQQSEVTSPAAGTENE